MQECLGETSLTLTLPPEQQYTFTSNNEKNQTCNFHSLKYKIEIGSPSVGTSREGEVYPCPHSAPKCDPGCEETHAACCSTQMNHESESLEAKCAGTAVAPQKPPSSLG